MRRAHAHKQTTKRACFITKSIIWRVCSVDSFDRTNIVVWRSLESIAYASLPMLVADLADEGSRDFLFGIALAEQVAYVPLIVAPVDRSTHALEVYSPDGAEPLRLLADPMGPPTAEGFPLRLSLKDPHASATIRTDKKRPPTLRAKHETNHELSERHTHDLEGDDAAAAKPADIIGRAIAGGKLQIESLIGGGGVGAVYRAQHRELRMPVAVKVLHDSYQRDADFGRRFHAEALAASRLDHPNVTRVLDFGQEPDGMLYLVMEYLNGVGLRSLIGDKPFDTERIVKILSQVCAGLAHAHARSIVHKDVKPENLVILEGSDDDGMPMEIVKVCDFGIAQGALAEETRRFQGTPEYMSPEQCQSETLDARSDVYACGIVIYELATGEVPFTDDDVGRIVWMHLNQAPTPPSQLCVIDPRLEHIILRSLAKDKEQRFASMRDLRTALRDLLDKPPVSMSGRFARIEAARIAEAQQAQLEQRRTSSSQSRPAVSAPPQSSPSSSRRGAESPNWLIHGGSYELVSASTGPVSTRSQLVLDPTAFMRRLVTTTDPRAFADLVLPLEQTIRELVDTLQVDTLWRLASTLDLLATEGPEVAGSRAATSKTILRVLRDPSVLAPIAQRVITVGDATGERLLTAAGSFGAHALYSARVRLRDVPCENEMDARLRFISGLRAMGPAAMPILRGGLERLAERLQTPGAVQIAEDLLVSVAAVHDEALGALVAAYARCNHPLLARAAVVALPGLWHERSRPIVLGLLDHPDAKVSSGALLALAELGVSDEHTPKRVAHMIDRTDRKSVRLAAVRVLAQSRGDARRVGEELIRERLRVVRYVKTNDEAELALSLARSLRAMAEDQSEAQKAVEEASADWPKELRAKAISNA